MASDWVDTCVCGSDNPVVRRLQCGLFWLTCMCVYLFIVTLQGTCFKRAKLTGNADNFPPDCNVYNPKSSWSESDYVALMRMFKDRPTWEQVNRNGDGGLCTNYRATLAFEQHTVSPPPTPPPLHIN